VRRRTSTLPRRAGLARLRPRAGPGGKSDRGRPGQRQCSGTGSRPTPGRRKASFKEAAWGLERIAGRDRRQDGPQGHLHRGQAGQYRRFMSAAGKRLLGLAAACVLAVNCGYHLRGTGTFLPPGIKTVSVPMFKNLSTRYDPRRHPDQGVIDELVARGKSRDHRRRRERGRRPGRRDHRLQRQPDRVHEPEHSGPLQRHGHRQDRAPRPQGREGHFLHTRPTFTRRSTRSPRERTTRRGRTTPWTRSRSSSPGQPDQHHPRGLLKWLSSLPLRPGSGKTAFPPATFSTARRRISRQVRPRCQEGSSWGRGRAARRREVRPRGLELGGGPRRRQDRPLPVSLPGGSCS